MKKPAFKMGKTQPILPRPAPAPAKPIQYTARPTIKAVQTPHIGLNLGL